MIDFRQLEVELQKNRKVEKIEGATYASHLSLLCQGKLKALIRKKCIMDCFLEGVATQALWDTESCLPHIQLWSMDELIDEDENPFSKASNQTPIPFAD